MKKDIRGGTKRQYSRDEIIRYLKNVSVSRRDTSDMKNAFLNTDDIPNPPTNIEINIKNIIDNFTKVHLDSLPGVPEEREHRQKYLDVGDAIKKVYQASNFVQKKHNDAENSNFLNVLHLIKHLLNPQQPTRSTPSKIQSDVQSTVLKYMAFFNAISLSSISYRDNLSIDTYLVPSNTNIHLQINPIQIKNNIDRILKLNESNQAYPRKDIDNLSKVLSLLVGFNSQSFEEISNQSKTFIDISIKISDILNKVVSDHPEQNYQTTTPVATPRVPSSSLPPFKPDHFEFLMSSTVPQVKDDIPRDLSNMYTRIYNDYIDPNVNLDYIYYLDIWNPQKTYQAILGKTEWTSHYQVPHLLHHFRVCLEILHLIYFRLDPKVNKEYTYANVLTANRPFPNNEPLIVYTGWIQKIPKSFDYITKIGGIQLLQLDFGNVGSEEPRKYQNYYTYIDNAFADYGLKNARIDTLAEVLCLVFSVNYKRYFHLNTKDPKDLHKNDRYHLNNIGSRIPNVIGELLVQPKSLQKLPRAPVGQLSRNDPNGNPPPPRDRVGAMAPLKEPTPAFISSSRGQTQSAQGRDKNAHGVHTTSTQDIPTAVTYSHYCYITDGDIVVLRERYEKHCILIVYTLMQYGIESFHVPFPTAEVIKDLNENGLKNKEPSHG